MSKKRRDYERSDRTTRALVDQITENVVELARHPANTGDPGRLRALLAGFNALAESELELADDELEEADDD